MLCYIVCLCFTPNSSGGNCWSSFTFDSPRLWNVHSHGHLSDYAHDLAKMAKVSGAHVAIVTDYDIPGILIASALQGVVWLGVNEEMLKHFGLFKENKQRVVPYNPKKDRIKPETFKKMVESDNRFYGTVDIDFLKENKVELDAILSHVGSERLWNYLMNKLKESYPTRDYTRVISSKPSLLDHYPQTIKNFNQYIHSHVDSLIAKESEKIESELKDVEGFIDVKEKRQDIDKRLGKLIENDKHLTGMASKIEEMVKKAGYDISKSKAKKDDGNNSLGTWER